MDEEMDDEQCKEQTLRALTAALDNDHATKLEAITELLCMGRRAAVIAITTWVVPVAMNIQKGMKMEALVVMKDEENEPIYDGTDPRLPLVVKSALDMVHNMGEAIDMEHVITAVDTCYSAEEEPGVGELMVVTLDICTQVLSHVMGAQKVDAVCPWCKAQSDSVLGMTPTLPQPGELTLCSSCLNPAVWGEGNKLEIPERELLDKIMASEEYIELSEKIGKLQNPKYTARKVDRG